MTGGVASRAGSAVEVQHHDRTKLAAPAGMMTRARMVALAGTALLVACSGTQYVYEPTVNTSAVVAGRPASYYSIPPEAPRGDVRIATFGIVKIRPAELANTELRAIHLRLIVANNSAEVWTIDTRDQILALPKAGNSRPAYATVDQGAKPPVVGVSPGEKRTIDLFYPMPASLQEAKNLPEFDAQWRVQMPSRTVAQRTPFERLAVQPVYDTYYGYGYAWGAPYWYDPWYPRASFVGAGLAPAYINYPVIIDRPAVYSAPPAPR